MPKGYFQFEEKPKFISWTTFSLEKIQNFLLTRNALDNFELKSPVIQKSDFWSWSDKVNIKLLFTKYYFKIF